MADSGNRSFRWQVPIEDSAEEESWLITYLDVVTLLLVMFAVMLVLSGKPAFTIDTAPPTLAEQEAAETPLVAEPEVTANAAREEVPGPMKLEGLGSEIEVLRRSGSVSFRISNDILFESGKGMLASAGFNALQKLVPVLESTDYRITVTGHTDSVPINTAIYPSNWELSSARAGTVVRYLIAKGLSPERLSAVGYAGTRPLESNSTEQGRARNRRVELILETSGNRESGEDE